jgi:gas vesicle protein
MGADGRIGASDVILAFLVGAAAGATAALLLAPSSGRETRDFLSERARESQEKASELARQGREAFNRQKDTVITAIERGREAYTQAMAEKDPA